MGNIVDHGRPFGGRAPKGQNDPSSQPSRITFQDSGSRTAVSLPS